MAATLGLIDAVADAPIADIDTALDRVFVQLNTEIETLLDSVLYLATETSIEAALDGAAALLDETTSTIKTALDKVVEHLESDTAAGALPDSAERQLGAGDGLINAANLGANAAELYSKYADTQVVIARGFIEEAQMRAAQARGQVEEASQRVAQKTLWLLEVQRRIEIATTYISEAQGRLGIVAALAGTADGYAREAAQRIEQKRGWLEEVNARVSIAGVHVAHARERLSLAVTVQQSALGYIQEAQGRMQQITNHLQLGALYISQARSYQEGADRENQSADRFLFDAQERHKDYWEHLKSRVEMSWPNQRVAAVRQHPRQPL